MARINILHVTFNMGIGGTEQVINQLICASDQNRFSHQVACIDDHIGSMGQSLLSNNIPVVALDRRQGFDSRLVAAIHRYIKSNNIHIVHCHQYTPYVYGLLGSIGTESKVIFTEHGRFYPERSSWKRKLLNPVFERFTYAVTAISKATAGALAKYENFRPGKIRVIYNGIADYSNTPGYAPMKFAPPLPANAFPVLGTISRLDPIKNHDLLLRAFKRLLTHHRNALLLIVGDGDLRHKLERQTDQLGIRQQVIFAGYQADPLPWLHVMDIFVLPSLSEGTAMTLLEAMSLAKPVVATDVGGNPEIVDRDVTGTITPSEDEAALANAMIELSNSHELRQSMGDNGRSRFLKLFTANRMVDSYQHLYQEAHAST